MAEEKDEVFDKKAARKAEKEKKKAEKQGKKSKKHELDEEETTVGGKIAVFFVTLIILLIWLAIIVLLIKWDVGGFGSTMLAPLLKDVPYVNRILPDEAAELSTEDSAYAYSSVEEAVNRIRQLEIELAEAQNSSNASAEYIAQLEAQAEELARYKQEEADFEAQKQKFYEEVVFSDNAPDIDAYKEYYESIDPANAEIIYRQVVKQTALDDELEDYIMRYSLMKPKEAAAMFDVMTGDLDLVAEILANMDPQSSADILGKMNPETAARVTEIMKP